MKLRLLFMQLIKQNKNKGVTSFESRVLRLVVIMLC